MHSFTFTFSHFADAFIQSDLQFDTEAKQRTRTRTEAISDEIRATVVEHVVNHGLTMTEAGRRVQPNIGRSTVFHRENRNVNQCTAIL